MKNKNHPESEQISIFDQLLDTLKQKDLSLSSEELTKMIDHLVSAREKTTKKEQEERRRNEEIEAKRKAEEEERARYDAHIKVYSKGILQKHPIFLASAIYDSI